MQVGALFSFCNRGRHTYTHRHDLKINMRFFVQRDVCAHRFDRHILSDSECQLPLLVVVDVVGGHVLLHNHSALEAQPHSAPVGETATMCVSTESVGRMRAVRAVYV